MNEKELLTKEEVWDVISFANSLYGFDSFSYSTPYLRQQSLLQLNNNPQIPTYDKLIEALQKQPYDNELLVAYSEYMEVFDSIYGKTLDYFAGLLAFDLRHVCVNCKTPSDYKSKEYKDDLKRVYKFLDKFDYKQEFKKIFKELLRRETSYVWFRDSHEIDSPIELDSGKKIARNENFALQIMPQKFCKLDGYYNSSDLLYSFDMNYFGQSGSNIDLFAPVFKTKLAKNFLNTKNIYDPSIQLDRRNGSFGSWIQCSPKDGAYAFKLDISNFRQVPFLASMMKSAFNDDVVQKLQMDKNFASAYAMLVGNIPLMDKDKSDQKIDNFAVNPKTVGKLLNIIRNSLKENVKIIGTPTQDNKMWQYEERNKTMADDYLNMTSAQGASANGMIYSSEKSGQFEIQQQILTDFNRVKVVYPQFERFLNYFINRKTIKYKFSFSFSGLDRDFYRKQEQETMFKFSDMGMVFGESFYASALGLKPQEFHYGLEEGHYGKFTETLSLMLNRNTMKEGKESEDNNGRPQLDNEQLNDGGATAREYK